ncbi:MAG: chloride channel protein [Polyangiales bacterium]
MRATLVTWTQWIALGSAVGVLSGAASALFLWLLDVATRLRIQHASIVYGLPVVGLGLGWLYTRYGQPIKAGNNLIIDTLHTGGPELPLRMTPMVLLGTVMTHLAGGSAGREGTAVQMGASLADWLAHRARVSPGMRLQLLAAGVAGGFGSVFGTPVAGAVFGLELVVLGRLDHQALVPALLAACIGDLTTRALGITHVVYPAAPPLPLTPLLLSQWALFAVAVAAVSAAFVELTHALKRLGERRVPSLPARMFVGGLVVVGLWKLLGTSDYLGLGIPMILHAFTDPQLPVYVFALKLVFTAITLGASFPGGEVTPLFFIGAALGSVLARWLGIPVALGAGVGLAAMFAAAANTPLALSVMAIELLGAAALPHVAIVCALAFVLSGHRSVYPAQRLVHRKAGGPSLGEPTALRDLARPSKDP